MGKYDSMMALKSTTSRKDQRCAVCKNVIPSGESHYQERLTDKRIKFIGKRYHSACKDKSPLKGKRIEDLK